MENGVILKTITDEKMYIVIAIETATLTLEAGYVSSSFNKKLLMALEHNSTEELSSCPIRLIRNVGKIEKIGHFIKDQWVEINE